MKGSWIQKSVKKFGGGRKKNWEMGSEKGESLCASPWLKISKEVDSAAASATLRFVDRMGAATAVPPKWNARATYDPFFQNFIKIHHIQRGRISISIFAKPPICVCKRTI